MKKEPRIYLAVFLVAGLLAYRYHGTQTEEAQAAAPVGERIYVEN